MSAGDVVTRENWPVVAELLAVAHDPANLMQARVIVLQEMVAAGLSMGAGEMLDHLQREAEAAGISYSDR